jgi:hypothetical protein
VSLTHMNFSRRYAGLKQVKTPGISVAEAADQLRRLAYTEERLMFLYASRVVTRPERDLKVLLGRLQFEAGLHADGLRQRIQELRVSAKRLKQSPDEKLTIFCDELEHIPGAYPFLAVLVDLVLPSLVEGYQEYLAITNQLADYPSVRILRANLNETEGHLRLLSALHADLVQGEEEVELATTWISRLKAALDLLEAVDLNR